MGSDKTVAGICPCQRQPASGMEESVMEISQGILKEVSLAEFVSEWIKKFVRVQKAKNEDLY